MELKSTKDILFTPAYSNQTCICMITSKLDKFHNVLEVQFILGINIQVNLLVLIQIYRLLMPIKKKVIFSTVCVCVCMRERERETPAFMKSTPKF